MRRAALLLALALLAPATLAQEMSAADEVRYRRLIDELRCLVCQNQTIAESNAPLAADLRDEVRKQIIAGKTDADIADFVTARYGDFVLYRPPFKARTLLLWLGPFALLLGVGAVAFGFIRRSRGAPVAPGADPAAVQRLLDEQRP
ncbi:MAG TPA: cytochrome c-type biogenesis protein [Verrucomicrobiae bacterium]|nr:cytochrome c-type biogenesis protein [Verrucomicrobiae bacterium]